MTSHGHEEAQTLGRSVSPAAAKVPDSVRKAMWVSMVRIRLFEERVAELLEQQEIRCPTHLYIGQEAVAVGVCAALQREDYLFGTHRSHGHYLAKGGQMSLMMAELLGKKTGCSGGRGGSMHLLAPEVGILGTVPMVAATIPIAVGAALASVMRGGDRVAVSFFGDGATEEGVFHEALNFASLRRLPVIFVCENNLFSSHLRLLERQPADNICQSAQAHAMPGISIDGNDVIQVFATAEEAVARARQGKGPTLIECRTYRWRGHVGPSWDLEVGIRDQAEVDAWVARCPIRLLETQLSEEGLATEAEKDQVYRRVRQEVEESVSFARESRLPDPAELTEHVFAP